MAEQAPFLQIEKGEPYDNGSIVKLQADKTLLGRGADNPKPDVTFSSLFISRCHATISRSKDLFFLTDLSSKHGTRLNGHQVAPNQPCSLKHGDQISLSRDSAVFIFNNPTAADSSETIEFDTDVHTLITTSVQEALAINPDRREILMDGKPLFLSGKDLELLLLLYQNRKKAVRYEEIKFCVWPERLLNPVDNVPDVGSDEITALVYRLRKRLGRYGQAIVSVPRFGYMLDI